MVYFSVHISFNEIVHLQKTISTDHFCLCNTGGGTDFYYGAVLDEAFHSMLHALAAETLEELEYLTEDEFKALFEQENIACTGNKKLIEVE
jgi:hypothetical protein